MVWLVGVRPHRSKEDARQAVVVEDRRRHGLVTQRIVKGDDGQSALVNVLDREFLDGDDAVLGLDGPDLPGELLRRDAGDAVGVVLTDVVVGDDQMRGVGTAPVGRELARARRRGRGHAAGKLPCHTRKYRACRRVA